jgi:hypothetical protein
MSFIKIMKRTNAYCLILLAATSVLWMSCKKEESQVYKIKGQVYTAIDNSPLQGASVVLSQQVIANGIYNSNYTPAAESTTDASGAYAMEWDRTNSNGIKVVASFPDYISKTTYINPAYLSVGEAYNQNLTIHPQAFIQVRASNPDGASSDFFGITWANANFECSCCNSTQVGFYGAVDSTYTCKLYGNTWLLFDKKFQTAEQDTIIRDSIFVPAFQTSVLEFNY